MPRRQRLQDPVHGLIKFGAPNLDQLCWALLNTHEFQRLRRIRQLGFSEFVYPGATHTRLSHSIGVFNNARRLLGIIQDRTGSLDEDRAITAGCAALLHDLGHGPFSHTFEGVEKARARRRAGPVKKGERITFKKHEHWTKQVIEEQTGVNAQLSAIDSGLPKKVAHIFNDDESQDIYSSIVSSQFDADRLDYLRRDRYMTGIGSGQFDLEWLLDCLEVDKITVGQDDDFIDVITFVINSKGFQAAEGYIRARFEMYSMVYMHKTTRAAEKMLSALLNRLSQLIDEGKTDKSGLTERNPLVRYFASQNATLDDYLRLDDQLVWSSIGLMKDAADPDLAKLAARIFDRSLYKCCDFSSRTSIGGNEKQRFQKALAERVGKLGLQKGYTLLEDDPEIEGYHGYGWEDETALKKVLIRDSEQNKNYVDIASRSEIVKALQKQRIYRVYVPDAEARQKVTDLWKDVVR